jgi:hypothetical protein
MSRRRIFDRDPHLGRLLDELHYQGARDAGGLPLGNVRRHAENRLVASYMVLNLVAVARDLGYLRRPVAIAPTGAVPQDKRSPNFGLPREVQAAHALPRDLNFRNGGTSSKLYACFLNPFNRTWMERNVFGWTDRIHHLANSADERCTTRVNGMGDVLARACGRVANDGASPEEAYAETLTRGYVNAAVGALADEVGDLTSAERELLTEAEAGRAYLLDHHGKPLTPRPLDFRLGSPDPEARAANRIARIQVLRTYAATTHCAQDKLADARGKAAALRHNER